MEQAHIFFTGMVQGVGFRYTTQRIASSLGLKGWVKNLSDGRVEILSEGPKASIEKMFQELDDHFKSYIQHREVNWQKSSNQFKDFRVIQ